MNSPTGINDAATTPAPDEHSWRAIYLIVIAIFAAYVLLLTALSRAFQ
jgi:hypothetical protein